MTEAKPFPLNAWYAAAWSHEIRHELAARTICEKDVVLYRRTDGEVAALEDACWHRLLPLSLGRLKDDQVVCGYHGLVFNSAGRCTYMPAQKTINPSACVHAYPTIERHRLVWLWPGDPALADPAKMPDFHWNDGTDWVGEGGTFYSLRCDYRLVVDNLMDLTHETYVHAGSIGDEAITSAPFDVTHTDRTATVTRWMIGIEPPPFWAKQLGKPGHVDRWQIIYFQAPSTVVGDVGVALTGTGAPQGNRSQGVYGAFLAAITPETERTCHYFWNFVRTFKKDDELLTRDMQRAHVNNGQGVYDQDHAILEAQQKAIDKNPRLPFYNLNIDAGALWARRLTERLVASEHGEAVRGPSQAAGDPAVSEQIDWRSARLRAIRNLTPDIRLFEMEPSGELVVPTPGSHINIVVQINGRPDVRCYSAVGPCMDGVYRIAVKLLTDTRGGSKYMWSLDPGAQLTISTPGNHFALSRGRPEYLLLAGGIGITPIFTMALALAQDAAKFRLLYACRRRQDLALADQLEEGIGDRLHIFIDEEGARIDLDAEIARLAPDGEFYVCGPIGMLEAAKRHWQQSGRPIDQLRFETFGNSGRFASEPFKVKIPRLGVELDVPIGQTMLDALETAGIDMIYDCRRGECGLCALPIVEADGIVDHRDVFFSDEEKAANSKLCTCVSRVIGGSITIDTADRVA